MTHLFYLKSLHMVQNYTQKPLVTLEASRVYSSEVIKVVGKIQIFIFLFAFVVSLNIR